MVRPCVKKYRDYSDVLKLHAIHFQKSSSLFIRFEMPMPNSWSKKKKMKMHQKPHQQKPDIDNLVKAVLDSLFHDDSHVFYINAFKVTFGAILPWMEMRVAFFSSRVFARQSVPSFRFSWTLQVLHPFRSLFFYPLHSVSPVKRVLPLS